MAFDLRAAAGSFRCLLTVARSVRGGLRCWGVGWRSVKVPWAFRVQRTLGGRRLQREPEVHRDRREEKQMWRWTTEGETKKDR